MIPVPVKLEARLVGMALSVARSFFRRLPRNVQLEDIEQAALIGLVDGLRRHPGGEGNPGHDWYLRCRIRGEIIDELRRQDWSGRRRTNARVPHMVHFEDDADWQDITAGAAESPELRAIDRVDAAKAWATPLGTRDERIMRACFEGGRQHKLVANAEGVSEARVSQRVARSLAGMRCHLTGEAPPLIVPGPVRQALWKRQAER